MRHKLTIEEQLRGVRGALENPRTPSQFRPALRRRLRELERQSERSKPRGKKRRSGALFAQ